MHEPRNAPRRSGAVLAALLAVLALAPTAHAAAFPRSARSDATGRMTFVGTAPGRPIARPAGFGPGSSPAAVAEAFVADHAAAFGLARAGDVRTLSRTDQPKGGTAVRLQQSLSGVDVLGGELVVGLDADNNVLSVLGEAEPAASIDAFPTVAVEDARRTAIASVARDEHVPAASLTASGDGLRVFDPRIVGGPGRPEPALTWAIDVDGGPTVGRLVFVDAHDGAIAASIDQTMEARSRSVCDAANATAQLPCTTPVLSEGGAYVGTVPDVQPAYDFAGATYDFYASRFGRDSVDGHGLPLKSTVRYCDPFQSCPYANAFWSDQYQQMTYGEGYATGDDVVGHELTHGVTSHTSDLLYYYQSGAINESLSDVFGELIDQVTPSANDAPGDRWKQGESLPGGAIRDMKNPPAYGDPDAMSSPWYVNTTFDSGGVHTDSGVNNKAAYLLVDGDTFNGQTVAPIGLDKTARLYYAVQTGFLTSGSDYRDLGNALRQACDNLIGTAGFTTGDCDQVDEAVAATGMLTDRPEAPDAAECAGGTQPAYVLRDDMEAPARWALGGFAFDTSYATSAPHALAGADADHVTSISATQTGSVTVPAGGFLSFQHSFQFDANYDGGVIEASTDGGATWSDIGAPIYNGTIRAGTPNPLAGRAGFVDSSAGYRRAVLSLGAFAGQSVRFRFRVGTDDSIGAGGWFVDDLHVGSCVAAAGDPEVATGAAGAITDSGATLAGTVDPNGYETAYRFDVGTTTAYGSVAPAAKASAGQGQDPVAVSVPVGGLAPATTYHYRLVAVRDGATRFFGADRTFTTAAVPAPQPDAPAGGGAAPAGPAAAAPPAGGATAIAPPAPLVRTLRGSAGKGAKALKVTCTLTTPAAPAKPALRCAVVYAPAAGRAVSATLTRGGTTYAAGKARRAAGGRVTLTGTRALTAGRYRLALRIGTGRRARTTRITVALR